MSRQRSDTGGTVAVRDAVVLAAGLARGLEAATILEDAPPRPLIPMDGRTLIDHALDRLVDAGTERAVVTVYRDAERIQQHLAGRARPAIHFREERPLLETGGGVKAALEMIDGQPFFVVDTDVMWLNGPTPALERMKRLWDDATMDALVLAAPTVTAHGKDGPGEFFMDQDGRMALKPVDGIAPYYFAGVQILHPRLFDGSPDGAFPIGERWQQAEAHGRLWGLVHDGAWFHIGTPQGLAEVQETLTNKRLRWIEA